MKGFIVILLAIGASVCGFVAYPFLSVALEHGDPISNQSDGNEIKEEVPPTVDEMSAAMQQLMDLSGDEGKPDADTVAQLFSVITKAHAAHSQDTSQSQDQVQYNMLYAAFAATEIDRTTYRGDFDKIAKQIIADEPSSDLASQATLMGIFVNHDFRQPANQALFVDLSRFLTNYPNHGTKLLTAVAREFAKNGQVQSVGLVLNYGLKAYKSRPEEKFFRDQLISMGLARAQPSRSKKAKISWDATSSMPLPANLKHKAYKDPLAPRSAGNQMMQDWIRENNIDRSTIRRVEPGTSHNDGPYTKRLTIPAP